MKPKAFTLIETILTLVLLSLVIGIGVSAMLSGIDTWGFFTQRKELLASGRMAMDRMVREIRMVANTTSMSAAEQTRFTFTDTNGNSIRYSLSGSTINRSRLILGFWWSNGLMANVDGLEFNYYDGAGAVLTRPVSDRTVIRRVRINIRASKGGGRTASRTLSLQSSVWPRNLR
jgi:prepilin-type N-terminal cleavage/methylation domain-containing protein